MAWGGAPISAQQPAPPVFKVGYAERDITPSKPTPMWGYAARRAALSNGVLDPLIAPCVVINVGDHKLAIMGLDLGRGPRPDMMENIRKAVKEKSGVDYVLISGSHTHHGPVIELRDEEGIGKGKFDDAIAYSAEFEAKLIEAINEAAANEVDAKIGWASARVPLNRNRHTKLQPRPVDDELSVIRFDTTDGKPIAFVVNFAAHPTILQTMMLKFSAEWPGQMKKQVKERLGAPCIFMQGAAGDMSPNTSQITDQFAAEIMKKDAAATHTPDDEAFALRQRFHEIYDIEAFGRQMADEVVKINGGLQTSVPANPSIKGKEEDFDYQMRINIQDPRVKFKFEIAFFKELVAAMAQELPDSRIHPHLSTIMLNDELAMVGVSGEFFCNHANRLKERSHMKTLLFGYCNGHHMYFPTIEAASEGGYGADPTVSWVALGAGEEMMNHALIQIYMFLGRYDFKF